MFRRFWEMVLTNLILTEWPIWIWQLTGQFHSQGNKYDCTWPWPRPVSRWITVLTAGALTVVLTAGALQWNPPVGLCTVCRVQGSEAVPCLRGPISRSCHTLRWLRLRWAGPRTSWWAGRGDGTLRCRTTWGTITKNNVRTTTTSTVSELKQFAPKLKVHRCMEEVYA